MDLSLLQRWTSVLLTLIILGICCGINAFVLKPRALAKYYTNQGLISEKTFNSLYSQLKKQSDFPVKSKQEDRLAPIKAVLRKYPQTIGIVRQVSQKVYLHLSSSECIRDLSQSPDYIKLSNPLSSMINPQSMVRMEGEKHRRMRKILSSVFHFDFVNSNIEITTKVAQEKLKEWEDNNLVGKEYINVLSESSNFAGEVVGQLFFGYSLNAIKVQGERLTDLVGDLLIRAIQLSGQAFTKPWIPYLYKLQILKSHRELKRDIVVYRKYSMDMVQKRKRELEEDLKAGKTSNARDLLYHLLKSQFEAKTDEDRLTDEQIMNQYILFVNAGEDTTGHLITMCLYNLTQKPEYKTKIRNEIKEYIKDIDNLHYEDINKMPVLNAFVKETLRLHSPAIGIFERVATKDNMLGKIKVKKGTVVLAYITNGAFRDDYFKDPEKFDPERWIGEGEGNKLKDGFSYLPFWAGPRNCLGQHLALLETRIFLIQLLSKLDLELIKNYTLNMTSRFLYEPVDPVLIKFTKFTK